MINIYNSMNKFTEYIIEVNESKDSYSLLSSEITKFINKVNRKIPPIVQKVIYLTQKYNLLDSESIEIIRTANKSSLHKLAEKYDISLEQITELNNLLKDIKNNIRLLPQYMSGIEREELELGKISVDDLTIDLKTSAGRNAAAKMYMPVVYKVVNQFIGKSNFGRNELMSAALLGMTDAMNEWDPKKGTFKTYVAYRVRQRILNDINELSYAVSGTSSYSAKHYGASLLNATSIDGWSFDNDDDFNQDRLSLLGVEDADHNLTRNETKQWNFLYDRLESQFSQRDTDIFYRFFGLKGYKKEKSKDIAKMYNMSEGNIRNSIINKFLKFLKSDKKALDVLKNIQDIYNESLMVELFGSDKDTIMESLVNDDMYILLEELNRWSNKLVFNNAIEAALYNLSAREKDIIYDILNSDFQYLDDNFKKNKKVIILFLSNIYPSENFSRKTDVSLLDNIYELQEYYNRYKK